MLKRFRAYVGEQNGSNGCLHENFVDLGYELKNHISGVVADDDGANAEQN
jgi:hypothetical protein